VPDGDSVEEGVVKVSAAWLINHSGFDRGFKLDADSEAALSSDHVLAISNTGSASLEDVARLAVAVRDGVWEHWQVELVPEPVRVGWDLPSLTAGK
jgi:UDP-N-acetylmuramate dehydrogenase